VAVKVSYSLTTGEKELNYQHLHLLGHLAVTPERSLAVGSVRRHYYPPTDRSVISLIKDTTALTT